MSNIHSPNVVTNGIVACWDAGSRASYPLVTTLGL